MIYWIKKQSHRLLGGFTTFLLGWIANDQLDSTPFVNNSASPKTYQLALLSVLMLSALGYLLLWRKRISLDSHRKSKKAPPAPMPAVAKLIDIDPLTNMHNLRRVNRFFAEELPSYLAEGREVWGIMLDIDKFEEKTRKLTMTQGSDLLSLVGSRWRNESDKMVVARWGGDEFLVISPDEDARSILDLTEELRRELSKAPFYIGESQAEIELTATAGISNWARYEDDERAFQDRLGQLMKAAKREGIAYKISIKDR